MRLLHKEWKREIKIEENTIITLVVENKVAFRKYIKELIGMSQGKQGEFVLLENNKAVDSAKEVFTISDLNDLNINSKKITSKMQDELIITANSSFDELLKLKFEIISYFENLILDMPYDITQRGEIDTVALLKLGGFKIDLDVDGIDYTEELSKYMEILTKLCGIKLVIAVGLNSYLSEDEYRELCKNLLLKKINIINIESEYKTKYKIEKEKIYIIDEDNCEI